MQAQIVHVFQGTLKLGNVLCDARVAGINPEPHSTHGAVRGVQQLAAARGHCHVVEAVISGTLLPATDMKM